MMVKKYLSLLQKAFPASSLKESSLLVGGTILNSGLGLIFYVLVARLLGPAGFGGFSFVLGLGLIASEIGDMGMGSALIKFGSKEKISSLVTLVLIQRAGVSLGILVLCLALDIFLQQAFILSGIVAISLLFVSSITQALLAQQKYGRFVATNILGNLARLGLVSVLFIHGWEGLFPLTAFILANCLAFLMGWWLLNVPLQFGRLRSDWAIVAGFSKWIAVSFSFSALAAKIDMPLVFSLAGPAALGIYSAAQKLTSIFPQIISSLDGVFSPKLADVSNHRPVLQSYLGIAGLFLTGLIGMALLSDWIVPLVFGNAYQAAIFPFKIMIAGMVIFTLSAPFSSVVIYYYGQSKLNLIVTILQFVIGLLTYFLLIPKLGEVGAAIAFVMINIVGLLCYSGMYFKLTNNAQKI